MNCGWAGRGNNAGMLYWCGMCAEEDLIMLEIDLYVLLRGDELSDTLFSVLIMEGMFD